MTAEDRFRILCVCTGNVCRSPAAALLLSAGLGPEVEVASAGTRALVGHPLSPPMDALVAGAGGDPTGFAARQLTERLARPADLVLALTREHRGEVVELWPAAVRRTFTLREFARLVQVVDPDLLPPPTSPAARLRALVPAAAAHRRQVADPGSDDVVDPYRRPAEVYQEAFSHIEQAVRAVVAVVRAG